MSRPTSLPGAITSATYNWASVVGTAVDTPGKHLAKHKAARGQDFWQSGWLWPGQPDGMSGMEAMCAIAAAGSRAIVAAADGATIGAVRMLTTAKIESRRGNAIQNFTQALWHM